MDIIQYCVRDCMPTKTVYTYPIQKTWFQSNDTDRITKHDLRIAKMGIQGKVELQFNCSKDTQTLICFTAASVSFHDELNMFYACFELANEDSPMRAPRAPHDSSCLWGRHEKTFNRVNTCKAAGPDLRMTFLKTWSVKPAAVFRDIFDSSLKSSIVPMCFKIPPLFLYQRETKWVVLMNQNQN